MMWNLDILNPNKTALLNHDGVSISYGQLLKKSQELGKAIAGDSSSKPLIICICTNTIPCIAGYIAFIENEYTVMMLQDNLSPEKYSEIFEHYRPEYIYAQESYNVAAVLDGIWNGKVCRKKVLEYMDYCLYRIDAYGREDVCTINDNLALLLSTSGTTGSSKMVRISYKNIESNTLSIIEALGVDEDDVAVTSLPCSYTYGLSVINTHIYVGATILVTDYKVIDKRFWDFFTSNGGTSFSAVAYTYRVLMRMGFNRWNIPTLRKMTQAGERLNDTVYTYLTDMSEKRNIRFQPMYGQTEATARITVMPYGIAGSALREKTGSVGKVIPGGKISISDKSSDNSGRIIYYGDNVMMGYAYGRKCLAKDDESGRVLDTGDYGCVDEDGFLYIKGRKDRYIKYAGKRIELDELECELEKEFRTEVEVSYSYVDGDFEIKMKEECDGVEAYIHDRYGIGKNCINVVITCDMLRKVNQNGKRY